MAIAAAAAFSATGVLDETRDLAPGSAARPLARRWRAQLARSQAGEWTRTNAGERSDAERGCARSLSKRRPRRARGSGPGVRGEGARDWARLLGPRQQSSFNGKF